MASISSASVAEHFEVAASVSSIPVTVGAGFSSLPKEDKRKSIYDFSSYHLLLFFMSGDVRRLHDYLLLSDSKACM